MNEVLSLDTPEGSDYTLHPDAQSCWVTVDNVAVYIKRTDEGVVVDLYPNGYEAQIDSIAGTYVFFQEVEELVNGHLKHQARYPEWSDCEASAKRTGEGLDDPEGSPGLD
jgi:hypothetical protein